MQFEEDRFIIFPEKCVTDGQKDRQTDTQINGGQNNTCLFGCVTRGQSIRPATRSLLMHSVVCDSASSSINYY